MSFSQSLAQDFGHILKTSTCILQGTFISNPQLIIVRGLSGSGKSTLAMKFKALGYLHIETDMFFHERGKYVFHRSKLSDAQAWCELTTRKALRMGRRVVVSNTFSRKLEVKPYLKISEHCLVLKSTGFWPNIHGVSDETIANMSAKWEDWL